MGKRKKTFGPLFLVLLLQYGIFLKEVTMNFLFFMGGA